MGLGDTLFSILFQRLNDWMNQCGHMNSHTEVWCLCMVYKPEDVCTES